MDFVHFFRSDERHTVVGTSKRTLPNSWIHEIDEGIAERRKIADLSKTIGTVAPDQSKVMFKIAVHNMDALHAFLNGSNPVSKPVFDVVMESYEIHELKQL